MSIEELVNRAYTSWAHDKGTSWVDNMHAALTEQAETHAIELRAYEATVQNLEQRIRELEAQRVPEGWQLVPKEPTDEMIDHGCDEADAYRVDIVRAYQAMLAVSPEVGGND